MNNLTKEDLIDIINTIKNQLINKSKRDFTIYTKNNRLLIFFAKKIKRKYTQLIKIFSH